MIYTDRILVMDYSHLCTKHFVKSCQLPADGYCSILASLAKPVSGLVCGPLGVSGVQCRSSGDCTGVLSTGGTAAPTEGSRRHPCAPRALSDGPQAFVTAGISAWCQRKLKHRHSEEVGLLLIFQWGWICRAPTCYRSRRRPTLPLALTAGQCSLETWCGSRDRLPPLPDPLSRARRGWAQCAGGSAAPPGLWPLQSHEQETDVAKWSFSTIPNLGVSYFPAPAPPRLPLLPYWSH